jgi:CubicO group peptidase (beta-lactamase class C family)
MKPFREKKNSIFIGFIFLSAIFFCSVTFASDTTYPTDGWQTSSPEKQGMQSQMLADMIEHIKTNSYSVDSVSIIRNGYLVFDVYFYPFSKGLRHNIYSCTKSIMSILIGIAIDKGYIKSVHQPIIDFFPDKKIDHLDDNKRSITLEHLLKMASGLECRDSYLYEWKGLKEMKESDDWARHVLSLPMDSTPGEKFEYCNGVSYLLSAIISTTTKMKTIDFAKKNLFTPLGISEIVWKTSPDGIDVGYGEMWLSPHDMAKIGWLCINKGEWDKRQIVSSAWVGISTHGHIESRPAPYYGYHWWVNDAGMYAAVGFHGQYILVADEMNMVIVFTGDLPGRTFFVPLELIKSFIIPAVASSNPLPENEKEAQRLDTLVKSVSIPFQDGFVWLSKEEGVAKDGVFRRTKSPKFMFEYPIGSQKQSASSPGQIMRMKTPKEVHFEANVIAKPEKLELKDFGPNYYAAILRTVGSDVEIVGNKKIVLKCGASAYRTDIRWVYQDFYRVNSVVVSSYKNNQCIYLAVHPTANHEKFARIVESLTFE